LWFWSAKKQSQFKAKQACPFGKLRAGSERSRMEPILFSPQFYLGVEKPDLKKQTVRQGKLVQFSRFESYPAKVSRPAGM